MKKKVISSLLAAMLAVSTLGNVAFAAKTDSTVSVSEKADKSGTKDSKKTEATEKKTSSDEKKSTDSKKSSDTDEKKTTDSKDSSDTEKSKPKTMPKPRAKSAIVIDANSGNVIFAMEETKKLSTAGTSNIMTALVALEKASLGDTFTVTEEALKDVRYDQPQLGMKVGETYSLEELLYAILLNSDNDAANVIAIGVSGSIEKFVQEMNNKAKKLKLSNTHYVNPTGWYDSKHYMSAEDLATLARYAMKKEKFRTIVQTPKYELKGNQNHKSSTLLSTNHLLSRYKYPYHIYEGTTGVKSGNSEKAGYCLVAAAEKNGLSLISVVMGCDNEDAKDGAYSFKDTAAMLDYVFDNYQSVLLTKKGDVVYDSKVSEAKNSTRVALTVENDVYLTLKKTAKTENITNSVTVIQDLKAPIHQGDYFGTISYFYNGEEIKTANVVAANEVKRDFLLHIINSILHFIFNPIVLIIIIAIIAIWARMRIVRNRKRRLRRKHLVSQNGNMQNHTDTHSKMSSGRSHSFGDYKKR